jgi:flagellin
MAITVNTNMAALAAQNALNKSTSKMNTAMERMTTGYKINSSKDDAAGLAVSNKLEYKVSSLKVAQNNAQMGADFFHYFVWNISVRIYVLNIVVFFKSVD